MLQHLEQVVRAVRLRADFSRRSVDKDHANDFAVLVWQKICFHLLTRDSQVPPLHQLFGVLGGLGYLVALFFLDDSGNWILALFDCVNEITFRILASPAFPEDAAAAALALGANNTSFKLRLGTEDFSLIRVNLGRQFWCERSRDLRSIGRSLTKEVFVVKKIIWMDL